MNIQPRFKQANFKHPGSRQQGVALIVSLIILVSLTLLGLTTIQRSTTDLAMAGNQRESGLMFQAAEVALVAAEAQIEASDSNGDFANNSGNNDKGFYTVMANDADYHSPDYFDDSTWNTKSTATDPLAGVSEEPRFMIEYLGDRVGGGGGAIGIGGYGSGGAGDTVSIYRAAARGTGLTGNSHRYVQSYYGKVAP